MTFKKLQRLYQTIPGYAVAGIIELALAYVFALWAIDNGNVWLYFLTVVLFAGAIQDFVKLAGKVIRHVKAR